MERYPGMMKRDMYLAPHTDQGNGVERGVGSAALDATTSNLVTQGGLGVFHEAVHRRRDEMGIAALVEGRNPSHIETQISVYPRVDIGTGKIDGGDTTQEQFAGSLEYIGQHGLLTIAEINSIRATQGLRPVKYLFQLPGNCMDGRGNLQNRAGDLFIIPRPKVVGASTLFVATVGGVVNPNYAGTEDLLDRVESVAELLGDGNGIHEDCGFAKGGRPVLEKYHDNLDTFCEYTTEMTSGLIVPTRSQKDRILRGTDNVIGLMDGQSDMYTEANMIERVRGQSSDETVMHYHGEHNEKGMAYLFTTEPVVIYKDGLVSADYPDVFYHNAYYAVQLIDNFVRPEGEDRHLAQLVGLQLPLAANAVLGVNQHRGTIGDPRTFVEQVFNKNLVIAG